MACEIQYDECSECGERFLTDCPKWALDHLCEVCNKRLTADLEEFERGMDAVERNFSPHFPFSK